MFKKAGIFTLMCSCAVFGQVDYQTAVQPVFNARCTSCHGGTSGVTLTGYAVTLSSIGTQYGKTIVAPGDTAGSPLWDKINPKPEKGGRMPPYGVLNDGDNQTIGSWILEGARETPTSVIGHQAAHPDFRLEGNYPNPFNPETKIRFTLGRDAAVDVRVLDSTGRLVRASRGYYSPGTHELTINCTGEPSGIFVAQITARVGDRITGSSMVKMTLIR
ncbi:hypothetical protein JW906_14985 [bacterium]|nr:hypothetical protein [bacterium]